MCNQGVKYGMDKHGKGRCVGIVMATSYFLIHYISSLKWFIQVQGKGLSFYKWSSGNPDALLSINRFR